MAAWAGLILVRWRKVPAGPVKVLAAQFGPGLAAGALGDAGQEQREPAQDDVGADALFLAVVDGAQVDDLLHVAPAALDLQQLPVAQRDVLG